MTEDPRLRAWVGRLLATPGLTAISDPHEAWRVHVEESLLALEAVAAYPGSIVDVGSGGGSPGIPLASAFPHRAVILLEAQLRRCASLGLALPDFPNLRVVRGRAEEQPCESYGVAVARALAPPPVAAEWCLPLVAVGGAVVLYVGPSADRAGVARVAERLAGRAVPSPPGLIVLEKIAPTPAGFPRRPGMARKRPLA